MGAFELSEVDLATEILAQLMEAGLIDSPGLPTGLVQTAGRARRQGVSYQYSDFSEGDIVGWIIDITSWSDAADLDWIDHIEELSGALPLTLVTGTTWVVSLRAGQRDSEVPSDVAERLNAALPAGHVQWTRSHESEWFEPAFTSCRELTSALASKGFTVSNAQPPPPLDGFLTQALEEDRFSYIHLNAPGYHVAVGCIFIENFLAAEAAEILDSYLPRTSGSTSVAGDGWLVRIIHGEHFEVDTDDCAEQIATALGATYSDSQFVDVASPDAEVDTSLWGPQSTEMKQMLIWASSYYFAVGYESWDDARKGAWGRIELSLALEGRSAGIAQARTLMRGISTNDFFDHTGVEAIQALGARDLISREDYDTFTLPWRSKVGRIHPDDPDVPRDRRIDPNALSSKMSPEPE